MLGLLGGYLGAFLVIGIFFNFWNIWFINDIMFLGTVFPFSLERFYGTGFPFSILERFYGNAYLFSILGGFIGGAVIKKRWGALAGGFILNHLITAQLFFLVSQIY